MTITARKPQPDRPRDRITEDEQAAIMAWKARNKITVCPPATMSWQLKPEPEVANAPKDPARPRQGTVARVMRRRNDNVRLAQMQKDRAAGMTIAAIARKHGLQEQTVSRILKANQEASGAKA